MAKKRAFPSSLKGKSTPAKSRRGQSSSRPAVIPWSAKDPENLDDDIYWEDPSMAKDENAIKEFKDYVFRCVPLKFPFEAYTSQKQMMSKIIECIQKGENGLFESPTGTGKTITLLTAALAWREQEVLKRNELIEKRSQEKFDRKMKELNEMKEKETIDVKTDPGDLSKDAPVKEESHEKNSPALKHISISYDDDDDFVVVKPQSTKKINLDQFRYQETAGNTPPATQSATETDDSKVQEKAQNESETMDDAFSDNAVDEEDEKIPPVPKIFILSRTQKQIKQTIRELRLKSPYRPKMAVLGSRNHFCINKAPQKSTESITEMCERLRDSKSCRLHENFDRIVRHHSISAGHEKQVWDIEDLIELGRKQGGCPYYASRRLAEGADVIFAPYNYIIDPLIRETTEVHLEGNVLIIDEAHNIESTACDSASLESHESLIQAANKDLNDAIQFLRLNKKNSSDYSMVQFLLNAMIDCRQKNDRDYMAREGDTSIRFWKGHEIVRLLNANGVDAQKLGLAQNALASIKQSQSLASESPTSIPLLNNNTMMCLKGLSYIYNIILDEKRGSARDYVCALARRFIPTQDGPKYDYTMHFWCLNPGVIFHEILAQCRSLILTSGTLSPLVSFAGELGTKFHHKIEAPHVIKDDQLWVGSITCGMNNQSLLGTYKNVETWNYQDNLGEVLIRVAQTITQGTLVFLPSYAWLERLEQRWKQNNLWNRLHALRDIFVEPRSGNKEEFEELMSDYEGAVLRKGAIMFAVYRGKMSEGIDFADHKARAVVCVGIPFPSIKDFRVQHKREYNNSLSQMTGLLTGSEWYEIQAYRALNQALGRCIRHRNDWGAILLVDERFGRKKTCDNLSRWVRQRVHVWNDFHAAVANLSGFYQQRLLLDEHLKDETRSANPISPESSGICDNVENIVQGQTDFRLTEKPAQESNLCTPAPIGLSGIPFFPGTSPQTPSNPSANIGNPVETPLSTKVLNEGQSRIDSFFVSSPMPTEP